jgi:hypothetical protein
MIDNKLYDQSSGDFACKAFHPKGFSHWWIMLHSLGLLH